MTFNILVTNSLGNAVSPVWWQANADLLVIELLVTSFCEIWIVFLWLSYNAWKNYQCKISAMLLRPQNKGFHYSDVIMGMMASQITSPATVYLTVYSGADQRKHQSSASLAFVRGIHRWPVNSPHKGPIARKMFPFDDVIIWIPLHCIYGSLT